jgi:hypothetical protein
VGLYIIYLCTSNSIAHLSLFVNFINLFFSLNLFQVRASSERVVEMERSVMDQISTLEAQQEGLQRALEEAREAALKGRAEAAERESCLRRELDSAVTEYAGEMSTDVMLQVCSATYDYTEK